MIKSNLGKKKLDSSLHFTVLQRAIEGRLGKSSSREMEAGLLSRPHGTLFTAKVHEELYWLDDAWAISS